MLNFDKKRSSYGSSWTQCALGTNQLTSRPGSVGPTFLGLQIIVFFLAPNFLPGAFSNLSLCVLQTSYTLVHQLRIMKGVACLTTIIIIMNASGKSSSNWLQIPQSSQGNTHPSSHKLKLVSSSLLP